MKTQYIWDLANPDDIESYEVHHKARDMHSCLFDLGEYYRRKYKHEAPASDEASREFSDCRQKFFDLLEAYEVRL